VKARGGIYEVLWFAEQVALQEGVITLDSDYRALLTPEARNVFSGYSLVVGSTGNLGSALESWGVPLVSMWKYTCPRKLPLGKRKNFAV